MLSECASSAAIDPARRPGPMVRCMDARTSRSFAPALLRALPSAAAACVVLAPRVDASGAPLVFEFEGTVASLADDSGILASHAAPGDAVRITAAMNPIATDNEADPHRGAYSATGTPFGLRLQIGALSLVADAVSMFVGDNAPPSQADMVRIESFFEQRSAEPRLSVFAQVMLLDERGAALEGDSLPRQLPPLVHFSTARQFVLSGSVIGGSDSFSLVADLKTAPTPPGAALLFGAFGLAGGRRVRRRSGSER